MVPGIFGQRVSTNHTAHMAETDHSLVTKLEAYLSWAADEKRIAGILAWHWNLGGFIKPDTMTCGRISFIDP